jgi:dihydrodipicolinate synthase/N-acetylneuraminate lyase
MGLCREDVRLPLAPCSETARAQVLEALRAAGINWS